MYFFLSLDYFVSYKIKLFLCFTQVEDWCKINFFKMKESSQRNFRNFVISLEAITIAGAICFRCVGTQDLHAFKIGMMDVGLQKST